MMKRRLTVLLLLLSAMVGARISGAEPASPVIAAPAVSPAAYGLGKGLVLHFTFDKTQTKVTDKSGKNNHGTVHGAKHTDNGRTGGALRLDGKGDYVHVPNSTGIEVRAAVTVAVWINLSSFNPKGYANEHGYVVNKGKDLWWNPAFCLGYGKSKGQVLFHVCKAGGAQNGGGKSAVSAPRLQPGKWFHLAGTYDGKAVKVYVNGKCEKTEKYSGPLRHDRAPVLIGGGNLSGTGWGNHFTVDAVVDDVMIWNRALDAGEIRGLATGLAVGMPHITRSPLADRLELTDGSVILGTIRNTGYTIAASFGKVKIPARRVVGIVSDAAGESRVRVVLTDGQVVRGAPGGETILFATESGSPLKVPLARIAECGYCVTKARPAAPAAAGPMAVLRGGQRLVWTACAEKLHLAAPYQEIPLRAEAVLRIDALNAKGPVHRVLLVNGSTCSGTLKPRKLTLALQLGPHITVAIGDLVRLAGRGKPVAPAGAATMTMLNGDRLLGRLADARLTIRTEFGDTPVAPGDVRTITPDAKARGTVVVRMWDGTTLRGRLAEPGVTFAVAPGGPTIKVRAVRIASIVRSGRGHSPELRKKVERLVAQLGAESYQDREAATKALVKMGKSIVPLLKPHLKSRDPEIRQRIQDILEQLGVK